MSKKASDPSDFPGEVLLCRERGHHWEKRNEQVTFGARKRAVEVERFSTCPVCSLDKIETITLPDFVIVKRTYDYPDFYLADVPAMGGRMYRADVRREQFTRAGIKF